MCAQPSDALPAFHLVAIAGALVSLLAACPAAVLWARGRAACTSPLERSDESRNALRRVDLGIGEGLWSTLGRASAYRGAPPVDVLIEGNPAATMRALCLDVICAGAFVIGAVALALFGPWSTGRGTLNVVHSHLDIHTYEVRAGVASPCSGGHSTRRPAGCP
jgi:hypothetical protein